MDLACATDLKLDKTSCIPWLFLSALIRKGDHVVDATAGKGRDTLALARMVGPLGRVDAFDIQAEALDQTKDLLYSYHLESHVCLRLYDHALMTDVVNPGIRAAVFNLGYLPGSNHQVKTRPSSTLQAIQGAMGLLCPGGAIVLTVYRGHPGGTEESRCLSAYLQTVPSQGYCVLEGKYLNHEDNAPYWVIIQEKGRRSV